MGVKLSLKDLFVLYIRPLAILATFYIVLDLVLDEVVDYFSKKYAVVHFTEDFFEVAETIKLCGDFAFERRPSWEVTRLSGDNSYIIRADNQSEKGQAILRIFPRKQVLIDLDTMEEIHRLHSGDLSKLLFSNQSMSKKMRTVYPISDSELNTLVTSILAYDPPEQGNYGKVDRRTVYFDIAPNKTVQYYFFARKECLFFISEVVDTKDRMLSGITYSILNNIENSIRDI